MIKSKMNFNKIWNNQKTKLKILIMKKYQMNNMIKKKNIKINTK